MSQLTILSVVIGSRAYGIHNENSDTDIRSVVITPTSELLSVQKTNFEVKSKHKQEDGQDDVSYEIGHFLHLAIASNPTILEIFVCPVKTITPLGYELRDLFPYVWSSQGVRNAFMGYSTNQVKRAKEGGGGLPDKRNRKFLMAYIRTLIFGGYLLTYGTLPIPLDEDVKKLLLDIKSGEIKPAAVMKLGEIYAGTLINAFNNAPVKLSDITKVNEFLLRVRKDNW